MFMPTLSQTSTLALPPITPHAIRDELTEMLVNDLLGPTAGPEEDLDQREDRVTARYLVGILAPESTPVEVNARGEMVVQPQPDLFESNCA